MREARSLRARWRMGKPMFERYTEKARRVIFFARYEASQFGSPYIESEHLLLGLLREDKALANRFLRSHAAIESIRKQVEAHTTVRENFWNRPRTQPHRPTTSNTSARASAAGCDTPSTRGALCARVERYQNRLGDT